MKNTLLKIPLIFSAIIFISCSTTYINRNPAGDIFPSVLGESLEKNKIKMPDYFRGSPTVLLLGYKQDSQFDIDRWLIGLDMTKTDVKFYELPTIQGLFPRMFSTVIDNGMRSGIPKELWGGVITVYADGAELQEFTGNENPNNARVLLLDGNGKIVYFHDRGFSVQELNKLRAELNTLVENQ